METKIRKIRQLTTILLTIPYIFLLLQIVDSFVHVLPNGAEFWALFCFTLFPISFITLIILFFLNRTLRESKLNSSSFDKMKIFIGVISSILGLLLWGLLYVVIGI